MRKAVYLPLLFLLLVPATGCADFKSYMKDRGNDLADCFTARVGTCFGLGARVQATNYIAVSVGISGDEGKVGYFGRETIERGSGWMGLPLGQFAIPVSILIAVNGGYPNEPNLPNSPLFYAVAPFLLTDWHRPDLNSLPGGVYLLGVNIADIFAPADRGLSDFSERMRPSTPFLREKFYFECSVTLIAVGLDIGFNPVEFVDFLLGWTTLDITGDDSVIETEQEAEP